MQLDLVPAADVEHHLREELFRELDQVLVIRVGPVELARRELGVVREVHPLVAEEAADLVHPVQPSDDQHLEVELGRDPHVHVEVEVVVLGDEGARRRAARDRIHHRRLDLEEAVHVEEAAEEVDGARAGDERAARRRVHDQVEVALAVASLLVCEAARAGRDLGQHVQARSQQQHVRREEGELAALRLARSAADADNVASLESRHQRREAGRLLVLFEPGVVAELVGGGEDLHLSSVADHVEEDESFSARALGGDPAGEADAAVRRHLS
mmetsp:Transcript_13827/g.40889  ORF Transcript_13827/g.40889 Transcript_13827/m.40889 type:complete len:270 (+) Transcript_13827:858-1667(+)